VFPSGARLAFGYADNKEDALRYQGQEYQWIGIDELPQYATDEILNDLRGSLRDATNRLPLYIRATGNPGNIGSTWVKNIFIDPAPPNTRFEVHVDTPVGMKTISRKFIPATVFDNPYLIQDDRYVTMLSSLPEAKRKQWLEGNWDVFEGAAFPEFNRDIHVVEPFEIPKEWVRFRACDWGYSSPACVLWFAVDYDNTLYVYREYYGKGLDAEQFARKILAMEAGDKVRYGVMDSSTWSQRGDIGPTVPETMNRLGLKWRKSDRSPGSRKAGKAEIHRRLFTEVLDKETGERSPPLLRIFRNCQNLIRTLPLLPIDDNKPEDVDTHAEDHAYDTLRYGCMSRTITPQSVGLFDTTIIRRPPADATFGY
jgi:hypothetical protein